MDNTPRKYCARSVPNSSLAITSQCSKQNTINMQTPTQNICYDSQRRSTTFSNSTTPRTPCKNKADSYHDDFKIGYELNQQSRIKNRPKNVIISPEMIKRPRNISPQFGSHSASISTSLTSAPTTPAYAGPTFHASPAPSTLPIPSFYSKSVPDVPKLKDFKPLKPGHNSTSPPMNKSTNPQSKQGSPLDLFFIADREQKQRDKNPGVSLRKQVASESLSCPSKSSRYINGSSGNTNDHPRPKTTSKTSENSMFLMELCEGNNSNTYESPTSSSYSERISASTSKTKSDNTLSQLPSNQQLLNNSEALKAYLFSGYLASAPSQNQHYTPVSPSPMQSKTYDSNRVSSLCNRDMKDANAQQSLDSPRYTNGKTSSTYFKPSKHKPDPHRKITLSRSTDLHFSSDKDHSYSSIEDEISRSRKKVTGTITPENRILGFQDGKGKKKEKNIEIQVMENNLRNILKLDPVGSSGVTGSRMGRAKVAAISVPNYADGNVKTMKGVTSGCMQL